MTPTPPAAVPRPEYLPPVAGTEHEKTLTTYRAPCEVCGADCDWTVKNPRGLCPCGDDDVTESDAA